jgi:hypothetical protein
MKRLLTILVLSVAVVGTAFGDSQETKPGPKSLPTAPPGKKS